MQLSREAHLNPTYQLPHSCMRPSLPAPSPVLTRPVNAPRKFQVPLRAAVLYISFTAVSQVPCTEPGPEKVLDKRWWVIFQVLRKHRYLPFPLQSLFFTKLYKFWASVIASNFLLANVRAFLIYLFSNSGIGKGRGRMNLWEMYLFVYF